MKSQKDQQNFEEYVDNKGQPETEMTMSSLLRANIPTVGYMGHRPVYRKPIVNVGAHGGHHFDLSSTKAEFNVEDAKGLSEGFAKALDSPKDKKIPVVGYRGFMPGIKARNFHGKSYRECAVNSIKVLENNMA